MSSLPLFPQHLPSEAQILLASVGLQDKDRRFSSIRQIAGQGNIDWHFLLEAAEQNRVVPLLCCALEKAEVRDAPPDCMEQLRETRHYTLNQNLLMTQELVKILKHFEQESIPVLPYKGTLLAHDLYGDISLRQIWDIDILVRRQDLERAKDTILKNGYKLRFEIPANARPSFFERECDYCFINLENRTEIELHWRVLPRVICNRVPPESIWEKATKTQIWGARAFTLPPEEMYRIVFLHDGLKHHWTELKQIADIARVLEIHSIMNWETLLEPISETRFERSVLVGFLLAHVLLGASLPGWIESRIKRDPMVAAFGGLVMGRLFRPGFGLPSYSEWIRHFESLRLDRNGYSRGMNRIFSLPRYLRAIMTPEFTDRFALSSVSPKLVFLQHLFRPLRLLRRHGLRLLNRI